MYINAQNEVKNTCTTLHLYSVGDPLWMCHGQPTYGKYLVMISCWVQAVDQSDLGLMPERHQASRIFSQPCVNDSRRTTRAKTDPLACDLLHPSLREEKRKCKLKRLVPSPNSFFMDVRCPGCLKIQIVFSHAQTPVVCPGCDRILCQPTGGRTRLANGRLHNSSDIFPTGCSYRKKTR
ncbi:40S ribosomal protein S27 [Clonorchis sinensis]|uniref:40S ribosomal protein S27 n=1 Tax=Clonorchis sinensis TaxID=79923 RepID=A0A419QFH8_CLOSI|nr:40S ribosomal protein S27 [Clonorchis sinensis]